MICAIVLAAGRSERMGTQKLVLPLDGKPAIARVVDELLSSRVKDTLVVIGRDGQQLRGALGERAVQFVENPDFTSDMLESVRCGMRRLPAKCEAVLIVLGDQPGITREIVDDMVRLFRQDESRIIVPLHRGHRGHPVLFSRRFGGEILRGYEGRGLRGFLDAHASQVRGVEISNAAVFEDMDTPADYRRHEELFATQLRRDGFAAVADQVQQPLGSAIP